jgi:N-acetylmuramoyl-L-alanine amidase
LEAQLSKTATTEVTKTSEPPSPSEIRQQKERVGPQANPLEIKSDTKPVATPSENQEVIIYRVQILAHTKPVGNYNLTISGKSYKTFEYLYKGGYRTAIGEFSALKEAAKFQNVCVQSGYKEAFVVAFKNNVRTNDPALFR